MLPGELRPHRQQQQREAQGAFALPREGKQQLLKSQLALCQLAYAEEGNYLITYSTPALPEKANIPPPCLAQTIPTLNRRPHRPPPCRVTASAADFGAPGHGATGCPRHSTNAPQPVLLPSRSTFQPFQHPQQQRDAPLCSWSSTNPTGCCERGLTAGLDQARTQTVLSSRPSFCSVPVLVSLLLFYRCFSTPSLRAAVPQGYAG